MAETEATTDLGGDAQPQPGTVIAPGATLPAPAPAAELAQAPTGLAPDVPETPTPPVPEAKTPPTPPQDPSPTPAEEAPEPPEQPQPADPASPKDDQPTDGNDQSVTWTASEFVAHDKSAVWYVLLLAGTLLLAALFFLLTRSLVTVAVVIVSGLLLGIYGARQPRQLEYRLDGRGVDIGPRHHGYDEFRSFSVVPEGAFGSIVFMPLKRFAVATTVYYAPDDESKILAILTDQLPFEEHRGDAVDSLMRHIRF
jgi:hypothetical protein